MEEWEDDPEHQPVPVTTAPPVQDPSVNETETTTESTQTITTDSSGGDVLPEDVWDDEE